MSELQTDYKTRQQPIDVASGLAPMPARTLARRRRIIRYGWLATLLPGLGLSAIPGPKGSSHTVKSVTVNGGTVQVHQFDFSRPIGLPFATGRASIADDGSIKDI